jgi:hypothetical protein
VAKYVSLVTQSRVADAVPSAHAQRSRRSPRAYSGLCNRTGVIFVQLGNIHNLSDIILAVGIWDIQNCMDNDLVPQMQYYGS